MAQKKETITDNFDVELQNGGTITYENEVIATIAGVAAGEVEGIAGMCLSGGFGEILGRNRNITKGVKIEIASQEATVDLYVSVEYGYPIQRVASDVQENVRKALESLTGLRVTRVDVHVQGVSFEKEKIESQTSIEVANLNPETREEAAETKSETPAQPEDNAPEAKETAPDTDTEIPKEEVSSPEGEPENTTETE